MEVKINLRNATSSDNSTIFQLINKMAEYEKLLHTVTVTEEILYKSLFIDKSAEVLLAEIDDKVVGFALYFHNFSTFTGKHGLYLEDIFVEEPYRGHGIGSLFFDALREIAVERNCGRMEWVCLNWNKPSIDFYIQKIKAAPIDGWTIFRLEEDKIPTNR